MIHPFCESRCVWIPVFSCEDAARAYVGYLTTIYQDADDLLVSEINLENLTGYINPMWVRVVLDPPEDRSRWLPLPEFASA